VVRRAWTPRRIHDAVGTAMVDRASQSRACLRVPCGQHLHRPEGARGSRTSGRRDPPFGVAKHRGVGQPRHRRGDRHHPRRRSLLAVASARPFHAFVADRHGGSGPRPGHLLLSADASFPARGHQLVARAGLHGRAPDRRHLLVARRQLRLSADAARARARFGTDSGVCGDAVRVRVARTLRPALCAQQRPTPT